MKRPSRFLLAVDRLPLFLLTGISVAATLLLTLMPGDAAPDIPLFPHADKVAHFLMFGSVACAALWDWGRRAGCITRRLWLAVALTVSLFGGLIELAQSAMPYGRSGDWADWLADMVGAFFLPLMLWRVIRRFVDVYNFHLLTYGDCQSVPQWVKSLYFGAFPPEERRDWADLVSKLADGASPVSITMIFSRMRPVGFITWWRLGNVVYVEHFAVDPAMRGGGIGARAIKSFVDSVGLPVVLEVEPADTGDMALRRIGFYERCGFTAHPSHPYLQPSYSPGLPSVPLMLMTAGAPETIDLPEITRRLHTTVYGVRP